MKKIKEAKGEQMEYQITISFKRRGKFRDLDSVKKWLVWFLGKGGASSVKVVEANV